LAAAVDFDLLREKNNIPSLISSNEQTVLFGKKEEK
jgi:hypothetical protein